MPLDPVAIVIIVATGPIAGERALFDAFSRVRAAD